jgi:hypothetical protein
VRYDNYLAIGRTILLVSDCVKPDSVALAQRRLFVVGTNCAESHDWPSGNLDGSVVSLADPSAAQIAVGKTWAAVTLTSGSVLQLPLTHEDGSLNGTDTTITLPSNASSVPLGAAFWGNNLGFTPAHSPDSFAIIDEDRNIFPIAGPTPSFPTKLPAGLPRDREAFGIPAIPRVKPFPSSSPMAKAACSTNPFHFRARLRISPYLMIAGGSL